MEPKLFQDFSISFIGDIFPGPILPEGLGHFPSQDQGPLFGEATLQAHRKAVGNGLMAQCGEGVQTVWGHLIVGPIPLHEGRQRELLPHRPRQAAACFEYKPLSLPCASTPFVTCDSRQQPPRCLGVLAQPTTAKPQR